MLVFNFNHLQIDNDVQSQTGSTLPQKVKDQKKLVLTAFDIKNKPSYRIIELEYSARCRECNLKHVELPVRAITDRRQLELDAKCKSTNEK